MEASMNEYGTDCGCVKNSDRGENAHMGKTPHSSSPCWLYAHAVKPKLIFAICGFIVVVLACCGISIAKAQSQESSTNNASSTNGWTAPARAARKENPVVSDAKSIAQGKELYAMNCVPCHGATGAGDGSAAAILERNGVPVRPGNLTDSKLRQETDGGLFWKITEGNTPMPSWAETLSEEQRWALINYVRTLPPQASPVITQDPKKKTTKPSDYD